MRLSCVRAEASTRRVARYRRDRSLRATPPGLWVKRVVTGVAALGIALSYPGIY